MPIFIKKCLIKNKSIFDKINGVLNCLSSGIFFGIITLDLWPAAIEEFRVEIKARNFEPKFPFAELCIGIGFFFVLIVEEFHQYLGKILSSA